MVENFHKRWALDGRITKVGCFVLSANFQTFVVNAY